MSAATAPHRSRAARAAPVTLLLGMALLPVISSDLYFLHLMVLALINAILVVSASRQPPAPKMRKRPWLLLHTSHRAIHISLLRRRHRFRAIPRLNRSRPYTSTSTKSNLHLRLNK